MTKKFNIYAHTFASLLEAWQIRDDVKKIGARKKYKYLRYQESNGKLPSQIKNAELIEIIDEAIRIKLKGNTIDDTIAKGNAIDEVIAKLKKINYYNRVTGKLQGLCGEIKLTARLVYFSGMEAPCFPKELKLLSSFSAQLLEYARELQYYINDQSGDDGLVAVIRRELEEELCDNEVPIAQRIKERIEGLLKELGRVIPTSSSFWDVMRKLQKLLSNLQRSPRDENPDNHGDTSI